MLCDVLHRRCVLPVMCSTCDVLHLCSLVICSTYDVLRCVLPMFYLCSTYVLLKMCSIRDKQRISTDVIMLCCSVLCQHMSTCVVMCNIPMCYDVSYCNNSSHHTSTHPCLIADGTQSLQHHYPSEHPVTLLQYTPNIKLSKSHLT